MAELECFFPESIRGRMRSQGIDPKEYQEVRLRIGRGVAFCRGEERIWLEEEPRPGMGKGIRDRYRMTQKDMELFLAACSEYSLYAFANQMKNGYLTVQGGHRIGFGGSLYTDHGELQGFSDIGSASMRVAREAKGCAGNVLACLFEDGMFCNTLILSPPGRGKTTLLRDLIRLLSEGSRYAPPMTVTVSDERGELAACMQGCPQMDLGPNTDVLDGGEKIRNLWLMLRALNPQILAADEIGGEQESQVLAAACRWGVGLLVSMHGTLRENNLVHFGLERVFKRIIEPKTGKDGWSYHVTDAEGNRVKTADRGGKMQ